MLFLLRLALPHHKQQLLLTGPWTSVLCASPRLSAGLISHRVLLAHKSATRNSRVATQLDMPPAVPLIWPDAAWLPRGESGALGPCSHGALGACQPVLGASSGCSILCTQTLGCVAWTYVRPEMSPDPTQWCAEEPYPVKVRANLTAGGRCCLQQHWPAVGAVPAQAACCTAGLVASPCREGCRMPWPAVNILDDLAPHAIDRQRRDMIGGAASIRMFPWVGVQQLHLRPSESPHKGRRGARQPREVTPRVAVCVAGAARALIHPLVWRSLERHVLGRSEGGAGGHDLFAVLGTGAEDQRSRTNELPLDEQPSLRSAAGAYLLSHALSALRPKAVRRIAGNLTLNLHPYPQPSPTITPTLTAGTLTDPMLFLVSYSYPQPSSSPSP